MTFLPGTELTRIDKQDTPYDVVRVVGLSPIKQASLAEWQGADGEHIIIQPVAEFGANEIMPMTVAQSEYEVSDFPEEDEERPKDARGRSQLSPLSAEQQFAKAERETTGAKKTSAAKDQAKPEPVTV